MTPHHRLAAHSLRWSRPLWLSAAALLLAPAVAMRFSSEVSWGPGDFAAFGALLAAVCAGVEMLWRRRGAGPYRWAGAMSLGGLFLLTWANLAVGLIGSEAHPANALFFAVPMVAVLGACLSRLRPDGLSRTLVAMALTQCAIGMGAWLPAGAKRPCSPRCAAPGGCCAPTSST